MKITIIGENNFIKKNIIENLKNIRDGKNRTRTGVLISAIMDDGTGDVAIVLPSGSSIPDYGNIKAEREIYVFDNERFIEISETLCNSGDNVLVYRCPTISGKWDESKAIIPTLCRCIANDEELPELDEGQIVETIFIEDLIEELLDAIEGHPHKCDFPEAGTPSPDPTAAYDGKTFVKNDNGKYCCCPEIHRVTIGKIIEYWIFYVKHRRHYGSSAGNAHLCVHILTRNRILSCGMAKYCVFCF